MDGNRSLTQSEIESIWSGTDPSYRQLSSNKSLTDKEIAEALGVDIEDLRRPLSPGGMDDIDSRLAALRRISSSSSDTSLPSDLEDPMDALMVPRDINQEAVAGGLESIRPLKVKEAVREAGLDAVRSVRENEEMRDFERRMRDIQERQFAQLIRERGEEEKGNRDLHQRE